MRYCKCLILFLLILPGANAFAQEPVLPSDITGLWKGTLYNDSLHQSYRYEIGISEEKGKLVGFTHTWYNEHDYFVVKKVKIKKKDALVIIEDVDVIAYNYPEAPPKGVKRLHVLTLSAQDSTLTLSGPFSTNRTKTYRPATGTVDLKRMNDFRKHSDLMPHLQELGLESSLSFVKKENDLAQQKAIVEKESKAVASIPSADSARNLSTGSARNVITKKQKGKEISPAEKLSLPVAIKEVKVPALPAAEVLSRKNILQETMYFKTDSLELALYDNGEVDGDTVSVLLNNQVIMAKQGLSTKAIRKTVYIPADADSITLLMYAENLGAIPPNTGLLIVKDGKENYEIRFSGDLQRNAAIIFKRRKN